MNVPAEMKRLPTFVAFETLPVLEGRRTGATIRLEETYFQGVERVLTSLDSKTFDDRVAGLRESMQTFGNITVEIDELTEAPLLEAATEMRNALEGMPEIEYLESAFPGECFVIPQLLHGPRSWIEDEGQLRYGARVFFFPPGDGPSAEEIIRENVSAVIEETQRDYEAYLGCLLGYPECCIDGFLQRTSGTQPPEVVSIAPLESQHQTDRLGRADSVDNLLEGFFDTDYAYAFFSREFFPDPRCQTAIVRGCAIFETLAAYNDRLTEDFFRLNYLYCYAIADAIRSDATRTRPPVGMFGSEHVYFYLPLNVTERLDRYQ